MFQCVVVFIFVFFFYSGYITLGEWCQAMEETTHLGLPWRMLKDKLVHTDPETRKVRYMDTFELSSNVRNFFQWQTLNFIFHLRHAANNKFFFRGSDAKLKHKLLPKHFTKTKEAWKQFLKFLIKTTPV